MMIFMVVGMGSLIDAKGAGVTPAEPGGYQDDKPEVDGAGWVGEDSPPWEAEDVIEVAILQIDVFHMFPFLWGFGVGKARRKGRGFPSGDKMATHR